MTGRFAHNFPADLEGRLFGLAVLEGVGGAQGDLYKGMYRGPTGPEPVVVKVMRYRDHRTDNVWRLWRSAKSPHIVKLIATSRLDKHAYEVTRHVKAGSLAHLIRARPGPMARERVREVVQDVAAALDHIHNVVPRLHAATDGARIRTWVHGDLKPDNLLVLQDVPLRLCLTDFGIARPMEFTNEVGSGAMTYPYAAPEMFRDAWSPALDW